VPSAQWVFGTGHLGTGHWALFMTLLNTLKSELDQMSQAGTLKKELPLKGPQGAVVEVEGKGEVIMLSPPPGQVMPAPVVWGEDVYCVPRPHLGERGKLLIGATVQEEGFDTSPTAQARDQLWAAAGKLMPSLKDWILADHWAGLRPKSPDGLPLLGQSALPGVFVAGGQHRNGILFAPAIAQEMADIVLGKSQGLVEFDPRRFSGET